MVGVNATKLPATEDLFSPVVGAMENARTPEAISLERIRVVIIAITVGP